MAAARSCDGCAAVCTMSWGRNSSTSARTVPARRCPGARGDNQESRGGRRSKHPARVAFRARRKTARWLLSSPMTCENLVDAKKTETLGTNQAAGARHECAFCHNNLPKASLELLADDSVLTRRPDRQVIPVMDNYETLSLLKALTLPHFRLADGSSPFSRGACKAETLLSLDRGGISNEICCSKLLVDLAVIAQLKPESPGCDSRYSACRDARRSSRNPGRRCARLVLQPPNSNVTNRTAFFRSISAPPARTSSSCPSTSIFRRSICSTS